MSQIDARFRVKKGLTVDGDSTFNGDIGLSGRVLTNVNVLGFITTPTLDKSESSDKVATTLFVRNAIADLVLSAPGALDTLKELADAIGDDPNFAATMNANLALKAPLASPALTGIPTAPTANPGTNTTQLATTEFVSAVGALKSNIESPSFTGIPAAPTPIVDTNTNQLATTAFVIGQAATVAPLMDGVATVGNSKKYARQDHVHASDTSKANLSGATFTGDVTVLNSTFTTVGNIRISGYNVLTNVDNPLFLQTSSAQDIIFRTSETSEKMRIKDSGRILIGTTADNGVDKLQVNGNISAVLYKGDAALTGTPTSPNQSVGDNSSKIANTKFVYDSIAANNSGSYFTGKTNVENLVVSKSTYDSNMSYVVYVNGGYYASTNTSETGSIKIKLPVLDTNTHITFDVNITEQDTGKSFTLTVSGTNKFGTTAGRWNFISATINGPVLAKLVNVRFGVDGSSNCIWVGDTSDVWNRPAVNISNVRIGSNKQAGYDKLFTDAWSVNMVGTYDTVYDTITASKLAHLLSPAFIGIPTVPTAAPGTNTTQVASTAFVSAMGSLKSNIDSPTFTGKPLAPTAVVGDRSTQIATTAYVKSEIDNLIGSAPGTLDTLKELADAIGSDPNFAVTVTNSLASKATIANPSFTGSGFIVENFVAGGNIVARGGLVVAYSGAAVSVAGPSTWQLWVDGSNNFNLSRVNASGQAMNIMSVAESTGTPTIKNSAILTGNPTLATSPSPNMDDNQIASTSTIHAAMDLTLNRSVTGGIVSLTAAEALNRVIILTGNLTSALTLVIPTSVGRWVIKNSTTGAFSVVVKHSSGVGVTVAQSRSLPVFSDGSSIYAQQTDYTDISIGGTPTTTTQAATDNSAAIATTAHVKSAIAASNTVKTDSTNPNDPYALISASVTLTLNTGWQDTGIALSNYLVSGSYMVQLRADDWSVGGGQYGAIYTGVMSWFSGDTNSPDHDEIMLHCASHASNGAALYLRVARTASGQGGMKLQISGDNQNTGNATYYLYFRRLI